MRPTSRLTGPLHTPGPAERSGAKHPTPLVESFTRAPLWLGTHHAPGPPLALNTSQQVVNTSQHTPLPKSVGCEAPYARVSVGAPKGHSESRRVNTHTTHASYSRPCPCHFKLDGPLLLPFSHPPLASSRLLATRSRRGGLPSPGRHLSFMGHKCVVCLWWFMNRSREPP